MMKTPNWLLPFTHGVDMRAIEYAVRLAESAGATLIPVSLISAPPGGARLEHIQQSKDFLEAVQYKAARCEVPVECYEVFTGDVQQSLTTLVRDMHCDGIVLVTGSEHTCLLRDEEVKHLLTAPPTALVFIRLSAPQALMPVASFRARFFSWLRELRGQGDGIFQTQDALVVEDPLWVGTEQHHLG